MGGGKSKASRQMNTEKFPKGTLLPFPTPYERPAALHPGFSAGGATRLPLSPGDPPKQPGTWGQ